VTVAELMFGALRSREPQKSTVICRQFCSAFQLVELDRDAGERSGVVRADLEGRGVRIGAYDVLIAGIALARIALAHHHVLATHNVREFGRVAGYGSKTGRRFHRPLRGRPRDFSSALENVRSLPARPPSRLPRLYSYRRAIIGSISMALRAGM